MEEVLSKIVRRAAIAKFLLPRERLVRRLINILRNEREWRTGKVEMGSIPYLLFLDVACTCTLTCPLCFVGQGGKGRPKGIMSMETFRKAIDEFTDYAITAQLYIRGEPLMNKRLAEMIAYADHARLTTSVSTHLNLLDEKMAGELVDSGLKRIVISLDGATEETYKIYRVGGDFSKVIENIHVLKRIKKQKASEFPRIVLQFLVFKFNLHEVPRIRQLAQSLGSELSLQQGGLSGPGYEPFTGKHSRELIDRWIAPPEAFLKALGTREKPPDIFFDYYRKEGPLCDEKCFFLWKTAYINWDGSVSPCCFVYKKDLDFGNIHEASFRKIWNNAKFQHARSLFQDSYRCDQRKMTICDSCRLYK